MSGNKCHSDPFSSAQETRDLDVLEQVIGSLPCVSFGYLLAYVEKSSCSFWLHVQLESEAQTVSSGAWLFLVLSQGLASFPNSTRCPQLLFTPSPRTRKKPLLSFPAEVPEFHLMGLAWVPCQCLRHSWHLGGETHIIQAWVTLLPEKGDWKLQEELPQLKGSISRVQMTWRAGVRHCWGLRMCQQIRDKNPCLCAVVRGFTAQISKPDSMLEGSPVLCVC